MFTIACCLVAWLGLELGLGFDLVSRWLVVMQNARLFELLSIVIVTLPHIADSIRLVTTLKRHDSAERTMCDSLTYQQNQSYIRMHIKYNMHAGKYKKNINVFLASI